MDADITGAAITAGLATATGVGDMEIAQAMAIGAVPPAGMPEAASAVTAEAGSTVVVASTATVEADFTVVEVAFMEAAGAMEAGTAKP